MNRILMALVAGTLVVGCGKKEYIAGPRGPVGERGEKGDPGQDGQACTVSDVVPSTLYPTGGAVVTCGSTSVVVKNGANGEDGKQGFSGADAVLEIIDPCGDAPGIYDEVILKLSNGVLLGSFSESASGKNTRFAVLTAGTYQTTDGSGCVFIVDASGTVR